MPARVRRTSIALALAAALAVLASAAVAASAQSRSPARAHRAEARTPQGASAVRPRTLRGVGSQTVRMRLPTRFPVVIDATHAGPGRFVVTLVSRSGRRNVVLATKGPYRGEAAVLAVPKGTFRVEVRTRGAWSLTFSEAVPGPGDARVPVRLRGTGTQVVPIASESGLEGVVRATHEGPGHFRARLIAYGDLVGEVPLFDQVGDYTGAFYLLDMPRGPYLVCVEAGGRWTIEIG